MVSVLVRDYNLHFLAIIEQMFVVKIVLLVDIKFSVKLKCLAIGIIHKIVVAVVVLGENNVINSVLAFCRFHCCISYITILLYYSEAVTASRYYSILKSQVFLPYKHTCLNF